MTELRSPFVSLEEWLFKQKRRGMTAVWNKEIAEANQFRKLVEKTECPACEKTLLKLRKFERGPRGYEAEVICEGCNFSALLNSAWTNFENIDSKGRAREK